MREQIKDVLDHWAYQRSRSLTAVEMAAPAVVFAPHPDDETLGCGGLIALKKRLGVRVQVVFLTDGRHSHGRFLNTQTLVSLRQSEALAACAVLGVNADDVHFFGYPDHGLHEHIIDAQERAETILMQMPESQVFLPYRRDVIRDHLVTGDIARAAAAACTAAQGRPMQLFEYPVWFWYHWPQTTVTLARRAHLPRVATASLRACWARLMELRSHVAIDAVLTQKKQALAQHCTQMVRPVEHPDWPILSDVESGRWLACFFSEREYFHREVIAPPSPLK